MVTGRPPRDLPALRGEIGKTLELPRRLKLYREAVRAAPRPDEHRHVPGMDRRLAQIIDACLESDSARRLRDGGAIVDALNRRAAPGACVRSLLFGLLVPALILAAASVLAITTGRRALQRAEDALDQPSSGGHPDACPAGRQRYRDAYRLPSRSAR